MPLEIWCEIVCSEYSRQGPGTWTTSTIPRKQLIREAQENGWHIGRPRVLCRSCVKAEIKNGLKVNN